MKVSDTIEHRVHDTIRKHRLFENEEGLLVSVSGGPDSVALLAILLRLAVKMELRVRAAHINHHFRGTESDQDERFVRDLCESLNVPLRVGHLEIPTPPPPGINLENEARKQRYDFLAAAAHPDREVVATGHTLDDLAETFLMKLCRGAGPSGLSGIFPFRGHPVPGEEGRQTRVVRPLLEVSRKEVLAYLQSEGLPYRTDSSNAELRLDRNWVRHQLLPVLGRRLNPNIVQVLARTARLLGETQSYLEESGRTGLAKNSVCDGPDLLIEIQALLKCPLILQKQIVREAICRVRGSLSDISQAHIVSTLRLLRGESGRFVKIPGEIRIIREFGWLRIGRNAPKAVPFSYTFRVPGELQIKEANKRLVINPAKAPNGLALPCRSVTIRNRRPGDRFRGSLQRPEKKLKRVLCENRIPVSKRDRLLVLTCQEELLWVEGLGPSCSSSGAFREGLLFEISVFNETFSDENLLI